jgi:GNAT superfamily N-acetyltransferase
VRLRGDEVPEALHVGAFVAGELLGIASVLPERPALLPPAAGVAMHPLPGDWRLRGMAVRVDARRHGLGRALLEAAVAHAIAKGGTALWCHARIAAQPFYTALGMRTEGAPFDVPEIGPHVFMWMPL